MGLRITTWNVNGIRNPFSYQPWKDAKSFDAMFDILESDIVVMQETKIQRKDLRDDMVIVPGWDCFFSFPKYKKGYSGVAIYTRISSCSPLRVEDGMTGANPSATRGITFRDLPVHDQIGGYPSKDQLSLSSVNAEILDSEGRCVILEFPAFVLIGVYFPAVRNEFRDEFRLGFLKVFECRIRNLVALGKRVVVLGDLNISRDVDDSASALADVLNGRVSREQYISTPSRSLFHRLVTDSSTHDASDLDIVDDTTPVLWDVCRDFNLGRKGMFTCWDMKTNARPGNFGSRIDYILCSLDLRGWFLKSDVQQHLMGSDHCPVFAVFKERVHLRTGEIRLQDIIGASRPLPIDDACQNPTKPRFLPLSGRRYPEFCGRRDILQMLSQKSDPSRDHGNSRRFSPASCQSSEADHLAPSFGAKRKSSPGPAEHASSRKVFVKGSSAKSRSTKPTNPSARNQTTLMDFYDAQVPDGIIKDQEYTDHDQVNRLQADDMTYATNSDRCVSSLARNDDPHDVSSEGNPTKAWAEIFAPKREPCCEGHGEPCISLVTKKAGPNQGRSFWMCRRPLGPRGSAEKGTQWRCPTFIWYSDWDARRAHGSKEA